MVFMKLVSLSLLVYPVEDAARVALATIIETIPELKSVKIYLVYILRLRGSHGARKDTWATH